MKTKTKAKAAAQAAAQPKSKLTTMRLDEELWERASVIAGIQRSSVRSVIEQCLDSGLPELERLIKEFKAKGKK